MTLKKIERKFKDPITAEAYDRLASEAAKLAIENVELQKETARHEKKEYDFISSLAEAGQKQRKVEEALAGAKSELEYWRIECGRRGDTLLANGDQVEELRESLRLEKESADSLRQSWSEKAWAMVDLERQVRNQATHIADLSRQRETFDKTCADYRLRDKALSAALASTEEKLKVTTQWGISLGELLTGAGTRERKQTDLASAWEQKYANECEFTEYWHRQFEVVNDMFLAAGKGRTACLFWRGVWAAAALAELGVLLLIWGCK